MPLDSYQLDTELALNESTGRLRNPTSEAPELSLSMNQQTGCLQTPTMLLRRLLPRSGLSNLLEKKIPHLAVIG